MFAVSALSAGGSGLLMYLTNVLNAGQLTKRRPTSLRNAGRNANKLYKGYEKRVMTLVLVVSLNLLGSISVSLLTM